MVFQKTEVTDKGVVSLPGSEHTVRSPLVISSIGSLPEPVPGVPTKWELYSIENEETGRVVDHEGLFTLGNAVTGRGNIRASRLHAQQVAEKVMNDYLQWTESDSEQIGKGWGREEQGEKFARQKELLSVARIQEILGKAAGLQKAGGYDGNYRAWIERNLPVRLEDL
jgi:hypothetical protein